MITHDVAPGVTVEAEHEVRRWLKCEVEVVQVHDRSVTLRLAGQERELYDGDKMVLTVVANEAYE